VENREWRTIAGPWYQSYYNASHASANPFTEAPRTAHILWKLEPSSGIGGYIGSPHSIETGGGEEIYGAGDAGIYSASTPSIMSWGGMTFVWNVPTVPSIATIMAGRGYYTVAGMIYCVDMRTGEELWAVEGSFDVGATRNRTPVLYDFGNSFVVYDAISGEVLLDVDTPGMSMAFYNDPYCYSSSGGRLIAWNVGGSTSNFASRILWNVTNILPNTSTSHSQIYNNLWISRYFMTGTPGNTIVVEYLTALNLTTGAMEYNVTTLDPADPDTWIYRQGPACGAAEGKFFFSNIQHETEGRGYVAYDAATGALAWHSEATGYPWGNFWAYTPQSGIYGMMFGLSYDGVYAFNATNGKIVWNYQAEDPYNETPYKQYQFGSTGPVVGGGIVFAPNTEHSPTFYYRNQQLHAIDAFTGDKVWTIKGIYSPSAIAYGILVATDNPNGFTYAFGKGSTATTVSASPNVVGSGILIQGTVTDQSTAQKDTAAIADEHMTEWMEYLHMQQPIPGDAKGVNVTLDTIDPNGNFIHIGTATSNMDGKYGFSWTPEIEGTYEIIATFEGSESYYASYATTYIGVGPAASAAVPIEPEPTEPTAAPLFTTTDLAIIAAVAVAVVIGIVSYWALRKQRK
jgi:outer membrane protein assembly factor BamB